MPFDAHLGWHSQPERSTRQALGLLAAWLACAIFSEDADKNASAVPFLFFGELVEHRNAHVAQPSGADLAMLEPPLREGCEFGITDIRHEWRVVAGTCACGACI